MKSIDIERNGVLYPIEIKKTGNPNKQDIKAFTKLDNNGKRLRKGGSSVCQTPNGI